MNRTCRSHRPAWSIRSKSDGWCQPIAIALHSSAQGIHGPWLIYTCNLDPCVIAAKAISPHSKMYTNNIKYRGEIPPFGGPMVTRESKRQGRLWYGKKEIKARIDRSWRTLRRPCCPRAWLGQIRIGHRTILYLNINLCLNLICDLLWTRTVWSVLSLLCVGGWAQCFFFFLWTKQYEFLPNILYSWIW